MNSQSIEDQNPYQSPQTHCEGVNPFGVEYPLRASFHLSDVSIRSAVRSYVAENPWNILAAIAAGALCLAPAIFFPDSFESMGIVEGLFICAAIVAAGGGVWWVLSWPVRRNALRHLSSHAILGPELPKSITVLRDSIRVKTADGSDSWPLNRILQRGSNRENIVLELEPRLLLVIPHYAAVDPQPFAIFRKALRRRLRRFALSSFLQMR